MIVLFESHDNDFTGCLLAVVEWFTQRVSEYREDAVRKWLAADDAITTLSEAFAAAVYARDCADVALDIGTDGVRGGRSVTLDERRQYLGEIRIRVLDSLPSPRDLNCNGEAVLWDGDGLSIV